MERESKNISIKLSVCKGSLEVYDDGEMLDLCELSKKSVLIKSLKDICTYEIRTRKKLGLFSEQLCTDGSIRKIEPDRIFRNVFIIRDFYNNQSLKSKIALAGLNRFEMILKAVIIENCKVDWKYECEESKSNWSVKMKTKLARSLALFKNKYEFIFENTDQGFVVRSESKFGPPIILINGFPSFDQDYVNFTFKNVFYINKFPGNDEKKTLTKQFQSAYVPKHVKLPRKGLVQASENCCFKGTREELNVFKANNCQNIPGQSRDFIKNLILIGQFDKKAILAKRKANDGSEEIWMFDQHACAERINLERLMGTEQSTMTREEMNMKACRSAVKFGDSLTLSEQGEIIKSLEKCNEPFHCAHGRPTCWLLAKLQ